MSGLGEQIAVLDGLSALDPSDGRLGQKRAREDQYARRIMANVLSRRNVIDASTGALLSGGSCYPDRNAIPLMPSSVGLSGLGVMPGVLPPLMNVIDPSGGANYTGGADWTAGMPLTVSNSGLAATLIEGGYGRAGLGAPLIEGGYGRAGLGSTLSAADEDLAGAAEAVAVARKLDPSDGRIGQMRAQVDEYGRAVMPGVLARSNVLDFSEGANYSGGSSYPSRNALPLLPSSAGLAASMFDAVPDSKLGLQQSRKLMGQEVVRKLVMRARKLRSAIQTTPPGVQRNKLLAAYRHTLGLLQRVRTARGMVARKKAAQAPTADVWGVTGAAPSSGWAGLGDYGQHVPMWAR